MKKLFAFLQNGANLAPPLCYSFCFAPTSRALLSCSFCFIVAFTLLHYSSWFVISLVSLLFFMLHYCSFCFGPTPRALLLLLVFHCCSLCFVVAQSASLCCYFSCFVVAPCVSLLFFVLHCYSSCFIIVPIASLLMLLCYSSFMHRCYVVFCCSLALLGTFLPLVLLLNVHYSVTHIGIFPPSLSRLFFL